MNTAKSEHVNMSPAGSRITRILTDYAQNFTATGVLLRTGRSKTPPDIGVLAIGLFRPVQVPKNFLIYELVSNIGH